MNEVTRAPHIVSSRKSEKLVLLCRIARVGGELWAIWTANFANFFRITGEAVQAAGGVHILFFFAEALYDCPKVLTRMNNAAA